MTAPLQERIYIYIYIYIYIIPVNRNVLTGTQTAKFCPYTDQLFQREVANNQAKGSRLTSARASSMSGRINTTQQSTKIYQS